MYDSYQSSPHKNPGLNADPAQAHLFEKRRTSVTKHRGELLHTYDERFAAWDSARRDGGSRSVEDGSYSNAGDEVLTSQGDGGPAFIRGIDGVGFGPSSSSASRAPRSPARALVATGIVHIPVSRCVGENLSPERTAELLGMTSREIQQTYDASPTRAKTSTLLNEQIAEIQRREEYLPSLV